MTAQTFDTTKYVYFNSKKDSKFTTEFNAWRNMKSRCQTSSSTEYEHYGGRGITVFEDWSKSFKQFLDYVGKKPSPNHTLDRINVDGNYEPGNVRWAKYGIQNHNQRLRVVNKTGYRGVSVEKRTQLYLVVIWKDYYMQYVGRYEDLEEAGLNYDIAAIQIYGYDAKLNILEQTRGTTT